MKRLILRMYKTPKEDIKKFDLICKYRYVYYDYVNNYITSAGIPEEENKEDFINRLLKNNKHRFTKKKYPLF